MRKEIEAYVTAKDDTEKFWIVVQLSTMSWMFAEEKGRI